MIVHQYLATHLVYAELESDETGLILILRQTQIRTLKETHLLTRKLTQIQILKSTHLLTRKWTLM